MRSALLFVLLLGCGGPTTPPADPVVAHEETIPPEPNQDEPPPVDPDTDPDADADSIVDANDICPADPENFNGYEDDDGCPDRSDAGGMIVADIDPMIIDRVYFDAGKSAVPKNAFAILDAVGALLDGNPQLLKVEVQGHTDDVEAKTLEKRMTLSDARAQAVVAYLVSKGIAADRLIAAGYADTKPLDAATTKEGRARNRRVEFLVLKTSD